MVSVIIVAGGRGSRMKSSVSKQFLMLGNKTVLQHTLERFLEVPEVEEVVLVLRPEEKYRVEEMKLDTKGKLIKVADAGEERYLSVRSGLEQVDISSEVILVHDAARPLVKVAQIRDVIERARSTGACILASKVKDTIKEVESDVVQRTLNRERLYCVATPQGFEAQLLRLAYSKEALENFKGIPTDDSSVVEALGKDVFVLEGDASNIKITTPEDLLIVEALLKKEGRL